MVEIKSGKIFASEITSIITNPDSTQSFEDMLHRPILYKKDEQNKDVFYYRRNIFFQYFR